jgi:hypothetical protein
LVTRAGSATAGGRGASALPAPRNKATSGPTRNRCLPRCRVSARSPHPGDASVTIGSNRAPPLALDLCGVENSFRGAAGGWCTAIPFARVPAGTAKPVRQGSKVVQADPSYRRHKRRRGSILRKGLVKAYTETLLAWSRLSPRIALLIIAGSAYTKTVSFSHVEQSR